jgi:5-methylcytosine-specific restriction endonuclease McrA
MSKPVFVAMVSWKWAKTFLPLPNQKFNTFEEKIHSFRTENGIYTCKINHSKTAKVVRENPRCVECGLKPTHLMVFRSDREFGRYGDKYSDEERSRLSEWAPDLRVIAVVENGKHILFTKDHIYPRSAGGSNKYTNLQTMCEPCNQNKGATIPNGVYHE